MLKEVKSEDRLIAIVCVVKEMFELHYLFDRKGHIIEFVYEISKKNPVTDSISRDFPAASGFEREITDFFGVHFHGSICKDKMFLPDSWDKEPPMKDG